MNAMCERLDGTCGANCYVWAFAALTDSPGTKPAQTQRRPAGIRTARRERSCHGTPSGQPGCVEVTRAA